MLGLRRRRRVEGWAVDVAGSDGEMEQQGLVRRVADNSKIWLLCLVGIVLLTGVFVKYSTFTIGGNAAAPEPLQAPSEFRDRIRYTQFAEEFSTDKRFAESVEEARFLSPGRFRLVVASGVSADEIDYVAKMAAERVRYVFQHRTVVQVYKRDITGSSSTLVATARWEPKKSGYAVSFQPGFLPSR
jgi:hypothetical protein